MALTCKYWLYPMEKQSVLIASHYEESLSHKIEELLS